MGKWNEIMFTKYSTKNIYSQLKRFKERFKKIIFMIVRNPYKSRKNINNFALTISEEIKSII